MGSMTRLVVGCLLLAGAWKLFLGPSKIQADVAYPLVYRAQVVGPAAGGAELPMLIALHGSGADETDLEGVFADFTVPVRVISFRAPRRSGSGYVWSRGEGADHREAKEAQLQMFRDVADSLATGASEVAAKYRTVGKPMVFGFSRGGSMAWYLGAHAPERFGAIFTVGASLEKEHLEGMGVLRRPPFFAYHGTRDGVVGFQDGKRTAEALSQVGGRVLFEPFDDGHTIPKSVRADVQRQIRSLMGG